MHHHSEDYVQVAPARTPAGVHLAVGLFVVIALFLLVRAVAAWIVSGCAP